MLVIVFISVLINVTTMNMDFQKNVIYESSVYNEFFIPFSTINGSVCFWYQYIIDHMHYPVCLCGIKNCNQGKIPVLIGKFKVALCINR